MKKYLHLLCSAYLKMTVVLLILCCNKSAAAIRYVKTGSPGTAPYTTWATASNDFQAVINASSTGDEIWVAAGTYKPNRRADATATITANNRNNAFVMKDGVKIYGGFNGTETLLSQQNTIFYTAILSGDIGVAGVNTDNCYHVLITAGPHIDYSILDGVTIQDGYADGTGNITVNGYPVSRRMGGGIFNIYSGINIRSAVIKNNYAASFGGGMYDSATSNHDILYSCTVTQNTSDDDGAGAYISNSTGFVWHCSFTYNQSLGNGGGLYQTASTNSVIRHCEFSSNTASGNGGGIYNSSTDTDDEIISCLFAGNRAGGSGGGVYNYYADAIFINCIFSGNLAAGGGGLSNGGCDIEIINCTIGNNRATANGGGIANGLSTTVVRNSILYGNTAAANSNYYNAVSTFTAEYSIVQGGYAGTNNSSANPLFVNPVAAASAPVTGGDYHLQKCSPAINAGKNSYNSQFGDFTLNSVSYFRIIFGTIDMGAYEYPTPFAIPNAAGIVYVDHSKTGNGSSWANAVPELADALMAAKYNNAITQIWVAKGTYYPKYNAEDNSSLACDNSNRDNAFVLVNNVKIYGGFAGGEITISQRNFATNITILSGDIGTTGSTTDNCYHVVMSAGTVTGTSLNGFYIRYGNANGSGTITVNAVTVGRGSGAGMRINSSSPVVNNCVFSANSTTNNGGGIMCDNSSPAITNCVFSGNRANDGAAMLNTNSSAAEITNCTFSGNNASVTGGAIRNGNASSPIFSNCIIWNNWVGFAADAIYNADAGSVPVVNYCLVQGGYTGINNINTNPLFVNALAPSFAPTVVGNYRLQKCSPAVNTGNNSYVPGSVNNDLDFTPRINYSTVDMGAYEKHLAWPDANGIVYVDSSNTAATGDGRSWPNAVTEFADALKEAKTNTNIKEIWTAKGTYKPIFNAADTYLNSICHTTDRYASFVLVPDVKIYGGFAGGETDTSERDFVANETILSGDIGIANNNADNCHHVVIGAGAIGNALIDGFTVTKGNGNEAYSIIVNSRTIYGHFGACMNNTNASPSIYNCIFSKGYANEGGGLYNSNSNANVFNCSFVNDTAATGGGAYNNLYTGTMKNCDFVGNTAVAGGGIWNTESSGIIKNCRFSGNFASWWGGAIENNSTTTSGVFTNCTIASNNGTGSAGGVYNKTASPVIFNNCIIWGNAATTAKSIYTYPGTAEAIVNNSIVEGGYAFGINIININPVFVNPVSAALAPVSSGDYRLQACSPAINFGDNSFMTALADLDNNTRIKFTDVDLGAYEVQTIDLANTTWKGVNTNWNDKINWCGGYIPYDTTNVIVPLTTNKPLIGAGFDNQVKNISFANGTSIGIANTGKFTINGTYSNLGSTVSNNGDWVMAGNAASQTFPGTLATVSAMNNLEVNNTSGLKFDKSFQLTGTLTPTAGNINIDNATITLNSDATSTARVAAVPVTVAISYTGTGKFEIERYIPPHRAWRLLTAPIGTATNLTISQAWQEGVSNANRLAPLNPAPGFGTTITKSTTYVAADGYDQGSTNNTSIRYFNGSNWNGVPSKTIGTTPGANDGLINDQRGYMLFVRGNRAIQVAGTGVTATVTTLRPKGQIKTGPQTITCAGWTVIGNPYASPINFHQIVLDNPGLPDAFYVWDANLAGSYNVGGWVSYGSYNGGSQTYTVAPLLSGSTFANNKGDISSGSAFMVNYTGTITINENHKSTLGDNVLLRPIRQLSINLFVVNADSTESLNDGVAIVMDASPRAANAEKNTNFTENLAIAFDNKDYAIQNRQRPHFNDTIFIYTGQTKQRNYVLEIKAAELNMPNRMKAYLEDTYLHQYRTVALEGSTRYSFSVNADSASLSSARFRLLFKKSANFRHIYADVKEKDIEVQWEMEENFGIVQFEIERSINGIDFFLMGNQSTASQPQALIWLDLSPEKGTYYYRIKGTGVDGEVLYSDIAKASMVNSGAGMYVYPNPVTGNTLRVRMNKQPEGQYSALLINSSGQKIFARQWQHSGGFVNKIFELPAFTAVGIYQLEITKANGKREVMAVEIQR